ncbi:MAG: serine/threonine protein kinase [Verrucomicrobiaceae bacterium]|nr:serine/threonine protein kinase [Verrucomicrobiaceae bacterium]
MSSAAAHSALLQSFGWDLRFEVLEKIGTGAMGQVWRAREIATGRIVALKMIDPARTGDEQTLARLEIEGETLTKLREAGAHEHVVPILDFKITEEHACLVMEFIPGLNLKKWCSTHQLSLTDRVRLMAQIARAAGWFHGLGIVHRDLKPANILVHATSQQPIVVDFSIAKVEDTLTLTLTNEALGTAPYMAPEQFDKRRGPITPATDVYALGATLYELLTQVHPHPGEFTVIIQRHNDEVRPAPPSALNPAVPRDLECILLKALSHQPQDRYTDGNTLADDLERFLAGEPVKARPLSLATRIVRHARRKPALTAALAACLVLGSIALWNGQRQAAQRQRFDLETRLTTAMQYEHWSKSSLSDAEATLAALAQHDATLATTLRQHHQQDVVHDIEARLQQPHLLEADFIWLRNTAEWLSSRLPEQAEHLQSLITARRGRWQTIAELRPPFSDMHGLLHRSHISEVDGLLYASHTEAKSNPPAIIVTDAASVPMEIDCIFVAEGKSFHHIALDFAHQNADLVLLLYKVSHAPKIILTHMGLQSADPQSYVLYYKLNDSFQHGILIPDAHLLDHPFRMTLRVEREWAESTLNDRWHLRLDSPFAFGSSQPNNHARISWPSDIGLQRLTLRNRHADAVSPLEQADLLAAQGQWAAARHLYENLLGDPHVGPEANSKIAQCLWLEGERGAAVVQWEKTIPSPPSTWRDRSLLQLTFHSLLSRDWQATARYAALLPNHPPPATLQSVVGPHSREFSHFLVHIGLGIVQPRIDPLQVSTIHRAFEKLQTPPLDLANRLGMALHFAQQDAEARALFQKGLSTRDSYSLLPESLIAITNCLDQWCRFSPSENDPQLTAALEKWQTSTDGRAPWHMEQARRAARQSDLQAAVTSIRAAREVTPEKLDNRLHTSLWLLEGMLYRLQGAEERAQNAWKKARSIAATVTMRHPLHLIDSLLLHSLTQGWNRETLGDVLTTFASRHLSKEDRPAVQITIHRTFLTDPAWISTFNAVLQSKEGRKFAQDYTLCLHPPRELVLRFYRLLFEHHFLSTAFPPATPEHTTRVRQIVDQLVTEMSTNPHGEIEHLYAYLRAWNDPAAASTLFDPTYPYSPALIENLRWLLKQRQR